MQSINNKIVIWRWKFMQHIDFHMNYKKSNLVVLEHVFRRWPFSQVFRNTCVCRTCVFHSAFAKHKHMRTQPFLAHINPCKHVSSRNMLQKVCYKTHVILSSAARQMSTGGVQVEGPPARTKQLVQGYGQGLGLGQGPGQGFGFLVGRFLMFLPISLLALFGNDWGCFGFGALGRLLEVPTRLCFLIISAQTPWTHCKNWINGETQVKVFFFYAGRRRAKEVLAMLGVMCGLPWPSLGHLIPMKRTASIRAFSFLILIRDSLRNH